MIASKHVDLHYGHPSPGSTAQIIAVGTPEDRDRVGDDRGLT
jgi:hypothetical protein